MSQFIPATVVLSSLISVLAGVAVGEQTGVFAWQAMFLLGTLVFLASFVRTLRELAAKSVARCVRREINIRLPADEG